MNPTPLRALTASDPAGWYQCRFPGSGHVFVHWWENGKLWNDKNMDSYPTHPLSYYNFIGPLVPAAAAELALQAGAVDVGELVAFPEVGSSDDDHPCVDEREWPQPKSLDELVTQINWIAAESLGRVLGAADKTRVANLVSEWADRRPAPAPAPAAEAASEAIDLSDLNVGEWNEGSQDYLP